MRKKMITLILGGVLVVSSIGFAFAADAEKGDTTTYKRGNGASLSATATSVEDLLKEKIKRIDQLVTDKKLTKEEGENYKKIITDRMKDCSTVGENRENHERLGIGFGRGGGLGQGKGAKNGAGRGKGCGMGFCRTQS